MSAPEGTRRFGAVQEDETVDCTSETGENLSRCFKNVCKIKMSKVNRTRQTARWGEMAKEQESKRTAAGLQ